MSKKSPIGYEPFVDVCVKHHKNVEAVKYLPKVLPGNKVKYYVRAGRLDDACTVAFEQKDVAALSYVQVKCGAANRPLTERIQKLKLELESKH